jgi:CheY-like chemotaxis protein
VTVLVVEDDRDLRELVSVILTGAGYHVVLAANGLEALARIREQRPALILLDMRMPIMDGWAFCAELRTEEGPQPPIVVVTAAANPAARAEEVQADGWLAKPFVARDLIALVQRFTTELRT